MLTPLRHFRPLIFFRFRFVSLPFFRRFRRFRRFHADGRHERQRHFASAIFIRHYAIFRHVSPPLPTPLMPYAIDDYQLMFTADVDAHYFDFLRWLMIFFDYYSTRAPRLPPPRCHFLAYFFDHFFIAIT